MWTNRRLYLAIAAQWLIALSIPLFVWFTPCSYVPTGTSSFVFEINSLIFAEVELNFFSKICNILGRIWCDICDCCRCNSDCICAESVRYRRLHSVSIKDDESGTKVDRQWITTVHILDCSIFHLLSTRWISGIHTHHIYKCVNYANFANEICLVSI
jgi:hypothetical protein